MIFRNVLVYEINYILDDWKYYLLFVININSILLRDSVLKICEIIILCGLVFYFIFKYMIERKFLVDKIYFMVKLLYL